MSAIYTKPVYHNLAKTRIPNLLGSRFGKLLVIQFAGRNHNSQHTWICFCKCGNVKTILGNPLRTGQTKSCGCQQSLLVGNANTTHGGASNRKKTLSYSSYCAARQRCNNPNASRFAHYGGRGIEFRYFSFDDFLRDLGPRPSREFSLERIDPDGHYEKGNVRWATNIEQANNKTDSVYIVWNGISKSVSQWSRDLGFGETTLRNRKNKGWCQKCIFKPIGSICPHK